MKRTYEPREFTNYLLSLIDDGILNPKELVESLTSFMSDDEVKDFMILTMILDPDEIED